MEMAIWDLNDIARGFTFELLDGRKVTYEGRTEAEAFNRATRYHPGAVTSWGRKAEPCGCAGDKHAEPVRVAGWLVCRGCAGLIGAAA